MVDKYGEKINSSSFYSERLFVAYLGQGDRKKAKEIVDCATRLKEAGMFQGESGFYEMMMNAYREMENLSDVELMRKVNEYKEQGKTKSE